jgi:hypothetical protein
MWPSGLEGGSVVEGLPSIPEALGLMLCTCTLKKKKNLKI